MRVERRTAGVAGHEVGYRIAGNGPPVVLLHGFLLDSRMWRTQFEDLSNAFTLIAWDAPGAGASSDPPDEFGYPDWAAVLSDFLEAIDVPRASLLGLSWGGTLALEFYRQHAVRVSALVLCDTYAGWKGSFDADVARQRLERCVHESELRPDEFIARWVPHEFFANASPELMEEITTIVRDFHPQGFRAMAQSLAEADATELLPSIAVPTLLLWETAMFVRP